MSYPKRLVSLMIIDIALIWMSVYSSYYFRFNGDIPEVYFAQLLSYGCLSSLFCAISMYYFKLYHRIWRYASVGELVSILKAVVLSCVAAYFVEYWIGGRPVPLSITLRNAETILLLLGGVRFLWRIYREHRSKLDDTNKALIVGAGACGMMIVKDLKMNLTNKIEPVAFIDDDPKKHRLQLNGLEVVGGRNDIPDVAARYHIDEIIIAIPSLSKLETSNIIEICKKTKAKLKIIPHLQDIMMGNVTINAIRDVQVEDLLGRDPVSTDLEGIASYVRQKVVLITGAGGSIGSELCRQIASFSPQKLLLLGHGENSIYTIEKELKNSFPKLEVEPIIADVQHRSRMDQIFSDYRPQVVFHAAAHKHVPLMEKHPSEAVKNNVFGTKNVADAADQYGTERFVLISSDKAVNPSSVMGTTKRIAEMYIQGLNERSKTKFSAVRFGNVLGSRGSVIPLFKEQIARGGPVTVTHPDMVRYFMTIPEAVQLVIQAGALSNGGEIFVLDMGEPVKILDLAEDLIRLSGFEPYDEIPIEFTGIRDGEKLFEELLFTEEGVSATGHDRIFVGKLNPVNPLQLEMELKRMEKTLFVDRQSIREILDEMVPSKHRKVEYGLAKVT